MELPGPLFSPSSKKKKNPPRENFLFFGKMELSTSNIKSFLIFSYISGDENPEKTSYIFLKVNFSYISGNRNPEKNSLYFRKLNFLIFQEVK